MIVRSSCNMEAVVELIILGIISSNIAFVRTTVSDLPRPKVGCGQSIVKAEARTKYMKSPGYPEPFPGDAKCVWAIYAENGKRIRLEFQRFILLPAVAGKCQHHYVIVKSPFSTHSMGPYCGEVGLPTIVSTGNLIYVELHTLAAVTADNYKGFNLAFKETVESSSYELRPDNSADDIIATVDPATMNMLSPTTATLAPPRVTKSTTKPWRFRPSRRQPSPNQVRRTNSGPPVRPPIPTVKSWRPMPRRPAGSNVILPTPAEANEINMEIIIAIGAGAAVAITIVIVIAVLVAKRKKGKSKPESDTTARGEKVELENQMPEVPVYPHMDPMYYGGEYPYFYNEYQEAHDAKPALPGYYQDRRDDSFAAPKRNPRRKTKPRRDRRERRER